MNFLTHACIALVANILCDCSGLPAERAISLKLLPRGVDPTNRGLSPLQSRELDKLLKITDTAFVRHGMECIFKEAERDSSKWRRDLFGESCVRHYDSHVVMSANVWVRWRKEEVRIGLFEIGGWSVGSEQFRATYSEVATNLAERFGVSRVTSHKLILQFTVA